MDEAMLTSSVGCEASMDVFFVRKCIKMCKKTTSLIDKQFGVIWL